MGVRGRSGRSGEGGPARLSGASRAARARKGQGGAAGARSARAPTRPSRWAGRGAACLAALQAVTFDTELVNGPAPSAWPPAASSAAPGRLFPEPQVHTWNYKETYLHIMHGTARPLRAVRAAQRAQRDAGAEPAAAAGRRATLSGCACSARRQRHPSAAVTSTSPSAATWSSRTPSSDGPGATPAPRAQPPEHRPRPAQDWGQL